MGLGRGEGRGGGIIDVVDVEWKGRTLLLSIPLNVALM
jgi:hypothetical protein